MREHPRIGALHRLPLRPVRRSLTEGLQSDWTTAWSGTPRQLQRLASTARRPFDSRWWFSHVLAFGAGATVMLLMLTR